MRNVNNLIKKKSYIILLFYIALVFTLQIERFTLQMHQIGHFTHQIGHFIYIIECLKLHIRHFTFQIVL